MDTERKKKILERLQSLEGDDGRITPEAVVEDARDPESPLHDEFEWDDSVAAEKYRLEQARRLLRVRYTQHVDERVVVAPYYVREPEREEQGYMNVLRVKDDITKAREVVQAEFDRVIAALKRARATAAVMGLADDIDKLLRDVFRVRERVVREAPQEGPQDAAE